MGLGMTSRVVEVWDEGGIRMARVAAAGESRQVCLDYVPDLLVGDYVVVHAGFAVTRIDGDTIGTTAGDARIPAVPAVEDNPRRQR